MSFNIVEKHDFEVKIEQKILTLQGMVSMV